MRTSLYLTSLALCLVVTSAIPTGDHDDHDHDHDHDHGHDHDHEHHGHDDENKIDTDGKKQADHDHEHEHEHQNVHHMSHSLDNLWARWDALEASVCGPKPDQAIALAHRHNMTVGDKAGGWKKSAYFKSVLKTNSEELGSSERAIYSGGHKMLEGDAVIPWFRMTKSAILVFWHRGANILIHEISANGTHDEIHLGDEVTDKHENFVARFPPNTWLALEIEGHHDDSSYAFFSSVLVPGYEKEAHEQGTEALVSLVDAEHAAMVRRLLPGAKREHHDHHGHHGDHDDHHDHGDEAHAQDHGHAHGDH